MRPKNAACCLAIALALVACQVLSIASPVAAIDLNPYDYFEFDYCVSFSDTEVEAGEEFQLMATAQVKCIKHLPFGADVAEVTGDIIATHQETGETHTLKEAYSLTITDVPDWKGDTYELDESISLMFPEGCEPGEYEVVGQLVQVTIDGWDVTDLVPESRKSVAAGTITCAESDGDVPDPLPGYLVLDVLGHSYQCEILEDGSLAESLDLRLVEGKISLRLDRGTFCLDRNGDPLDYLSVTRDTSPPPCESGSVLDAYKLRPSGARFDPYLELDLKYDNEDLPEDADEDELYIAYYDRDADRWVDLESQVDRTESIVMTDVEHFTTFGIIAETSSAPPPPPPPPPAPPAPASFVLSNFSISPTEVEPGRPVSISVDVTNVGGTEGNYTLDLLINGVLQNSREIILAPQESKTASYQVGRTAEGDYTVTLDGQSGQFTVLAASPGVSAALDSTPQVPSSPSFLSWLSRHWLLVMIVVYFLVFI